MSVRSRSKKAAPLGGRVGHAYLRFHRRLTHAPLVRRSLPVAWRPKPAGRSGRTVANRGRGQAQGCRRASRWDCSDPRCQGSGRRTASAVRGGRLLRDPASSNGHVDGSPPPSSRSCARPRSSSRWCSTRPARIRTRRSSTGRLRRGRLLGRRLRAADRRTRPAGPAAGRSLETAHPRRRPGGPDGRSGALRRGEAQCLEYRVVPPTARSSGSSSTWCRAASTVSCSSTGS